MIFRLHRCTMYVDAAYCYRLSTVVCLSVCHSSEPCKKCEPIEMPFGLRTRVEPKNHVSDGVLVLLGEGQFWEKGQFIAMYREGCSVVNPAKNGWIDRDTIWVVDLHVCNEQCIRWGSRSPKGMAFFGE